MMRAAIKEVHKVVKQSMTKRIGNKKRNPTNPYLRWRNCHKMKIKMKKIIMLILREKSKIETIAIYAKMVEI